MSAAPEIVQMAVRAAFAGIPGVDRIEAAFEEQDEMLLTIRFTGWGPSLHERRVVLGYDLTDTSVGTGHAHVRMPPDGGRFDPDQEGVAEIVGHALVDQARAQRQLSLVGAAHGMSEPLPRPGDAGDPETSGHSIGHLHLDSAVVAALLGGMSPEAAAMHIVDAVSDTIGGDGDEMAQEVHSGVDPKPATVSYPCATEDEEHATLSVDGDRCRLSLSRTLKTDDGCTTATVVDGYVRFEPEIMAAIPDTVADALIGRPLSVLAATGCPVLDDHAVWDVRDGGDGIDVKLRSAPIRLADHPLIGPFLTSPGDAA